MRERSTWEGNCECGAAFVTETAEFTCRNCGRLIEIDWFCRRPSQEEAKV